MDMLLKGKTILISGGTKGVGKALALECARQGANVVIGGRDKESAEEIIEASKDFAGSIVFKYVDLHYTEQISELFKFTADKYKRLDGFVNYAGITPAAALVETDEELFDDVFNIDIKAAFFCAQHAIKAMQQNSGGSIILVGSTHAYRGNKDRAAYACAKGALMTLSNHIAEHYAIDNIRCNYLMMGWTPTEGEIALRKSQGISVECLHEMAAAALPLGRMTEVTDIVPGMVYLLSDYASMVTATVLKANGGETI